MVVFVALFARACNRADSAEAQLKKAQEAARLADAGMPAEQSGTEKDLKAALDQATKESAAFKQSLDAALGELNSLKLHPKIVEVVRWRTEQGAAGGKPLPPGIPPVQGCTPETPCLVRPGTRLFIEGNEAKIETRAGNRVAAGSATLFRLDPDPVQLFSQPINMKLTQGEVLSSPPPAASRPWIAGITGSVDSSKKLGIGPLLGFSGERVGISASITFPNTTGSVSTFARF